MRSDDDVTQHEDKVARRRPWLWLTFMVALLAAAIYFGGSELLRLRDEVAKANDRADQAKVAQSSAEASTRVLQDRVKGLEDQLAAEKQAKDAVASEKDALAENLQQKEAEIARLKATYDKLNDKLQGEIKKGEILLTEANGRIRVDLVDKVLFDSGQADLSAHGQEVLTRVASVLKDVDDKTIQVSGHTDDSPITDKLVAKYPTNWELSAARAVNVVRFLTEQGKVPSKRLMAAGYGQYHPVASNATANGRAQNRRIEILLAPDVEKEKAPEVRQAVAKAPAKESKKSQVKVASTKSSRKK